MKPVKTHTFNKRKYTIDIGKFEGSCDQYKCSDHYLSILADLDTQKGLITAIHEALHACKWTASEDSVDTTSNDIGRFLWRLGFRIKEI